jgi:CheY-like chemotaxis protein
MELSHDRHPHASAGPRKTVLIIDDDDDLRDSLAEHIQGEGFETLAVKTGLEALDKLRWGLRPALILLDLQMTVMTGWDFRAEQRSDPQLAGIPVIAMTGGYSKWRSVDDFTACLRKPLDLPTLSRQLRRFCTDGRYFASDDDARRSG